MDPSLDVAALAAILVAVTLGAVTKGITGLGLPLIAVPVIAVFTGVEHAVLVMALPTVATNVWLIWTYRNERAGTRRLGVMLTVGTLGTIIGTVALTRLDAAWLSLLLGATVFAYLVQKAISPQFAFSERTITVTAPVAGLVGGLVHGATGASGPVVITYVHGFGLARGPFLLTITSLFQGFALVQMATFLALGRYDLRGLVHSLIALVPIMIMLPVGMRIGRRIDGRRFEQLMLVLLFLMGAKLLYDGFSQL